MALEILGTVSAVAANRAEVPLFAVIFPSMILDAIIGFVANVTLVTPKRFFVRMAVGKMSSQLVRSLTTLTANPTYHRDWGPVAKVDSLLLDT